MAQLKDTLLDPNKRKAVVSDCVHLVDEEVQAKSGLSAIAIKGAYAIVKRIKPTLIPDAIESLLGEFAERLQPFWAAHTEGGSSAKRPFSETLVPRAHEVAEALLGITDARAQKTTNATLKGTYNKLRPSGLKHVEAAVPGIARVIERHV